MDYRKPIINAGKGLCIKCGKPHELAANALYCQKCRPDYNYYTVCPDCGKRHTSRYHEVCLQCRTKARLQNTRRCRECNAGLPLRGSGWYCDRCRGKAQIQNRGWQGTPLPPKPPAPVRLTVLPPCPACGGLCFYDPDGDDWYRCRSCGREYPPPGYEPEVKRESGKSGGY